MTSFFLNFEPDIPTFTHQQGIRFSTVNGNPRVYKDEKLVAVEETYKSKLAPFAPKEPLDGPLTMTTCWYFALPQKRAPGWKTDKPDTDNLVKTLKDVMTACHFWKDDSQVAKEIIVKLWAKVGDPHGILVKIDNL